MLSVHTTRVHRLWFYCLLTVTYVCRLILWSAVTPFYSVLTCSLGFCLKTIWKPFFLQERLFLDALRSNWTCCHCSSPFFASSSQEAVAAVYLHLNRRGVRSGTSVWMKVGWLQQDLKTFSKICISIFRQDDVVMREADKVPVTLYYLDNMKVISYWFFIIV